MFRYLSINYSLASLVISLRKKLKQSSKQIDEEMDSYGMLLEAQRRRILRMENAIEQALPLIAETRARQILKNSLQHVIEEKRRIKRDTN